MSDATAATATTEAAPATAEAPADAPAGETPPETPEPSATDLAAEVDKWKKQSRKNEDRAKANATAAAELERLKREALPEQERLIEDARVTARAEALAEIGSFRVDDAVKLAAAGRPVDVDALLEGLDRTRFLGEDGQPDAAAITAWVDRIAPAPAEGAPTVLDLGQGTRSSAHLALGSDPLLAHLTAMVGPPRG